MDDRDDLRPAAEPIYQALKTAIIQGELLPGSPLRQDEIARAHGISKIPVREALLRLEMDGFVLFRKNRGAIVRELSPRDILNVMDIRVALECKALELAVPNMIAADFAAARAILTDYTGDNAENWSEMNLRFHRALYEPCDNPELLQMISDLQQRLGAFTRLFVSGTSGLERPQQEHYEILEACEAGDTARAVSILERHIETTKKETAARLRRTAV